MTLGEKIKLLRTKNGITQEIMAEKLNVSRSAIAKWETNNGFPEISNLKMISKIFHVSLDELINDDKNIELPDYREKEVSECSKYIGYCCDIELSGWNDGVFDAYILSEDNDFIFYKKLSKKGNVCGLIGKKYITSIKPKKEKGLCNDCPIIDRNYFCGKHVLLEIACKEGFFKGFFDFRNDDYLDVVVKSFENSKVILKFGKEINIDTLSKIEELNNVCY